MQKIAESINALNSIWQAFWSAAFPVKVFIIGAILTLLGGGALRGCSMLTTSNDPPSRIEFQLRVTDIVTGAAIPNAQATIFLGQGGPLYAVTDAGGLARFTSEATKVTTEARLIVEATGYEKVEQNISFLNTDLPHPVQLQAK